MSDAPSRVPVLTLDGPSGSGKGTVGQRIARDLGWHYLDSGALYRVLALVAQRQGLGPGDAETLGRLARGLEVRCIPQEEDAARIELAGEPVGELLRQETTGELASRLAVVPEVRRGLLALQRQSQHAPGLVADGRDMGSVVFPHAMLKVFLTADAEIRAQRRHKQLKAKGFDDSLARLRQAILERDKRDAERAESPLLPATDAYILDTTDLDIDLVVERVMGELRHRQRGSSIRPASSLP